MDLIFTLQIIIIITSIITTTTGSIIGRLPL